MPKVAVHTAQSHMTTGPMVTSARLVLPVVALTHVTSVVTAAPGIRSCNSGDSQVAVKRARYDTHQLLSMHIFQLILIYQHKTI